MDTEHVHKQCNNQTTLNVSNTIIKILNVINTIIKLMILNSVIHLHMHVLSRDVHGKLKDR